MCIRDRSQGVNAPEQQQRGNSDQDHGKATLRNTGSRSTRASCSTTTTTRATSSTSGARTCGAGGEVVVILDVIVVVGVNVRIVVCSVVVFSVVVILAAVSAGIFLGTRRSSSARYLVRLVAGVVGVLRVGNVLGVANKLVANKFVAVVVARAVSRVCLLYTSDAADDLLTV